MRSVFVYFKKATKTDVGRFLDSQFSRRRDNEWTLGDSLYIGFYDDAACELEPDEFARLSASLGRKDVFAAIADVSGRIDGSAEAKRFCEQLLASFDGFAMDDYSSHFWTIDEIRSGYRNEGRLFFDYRGWNESKLPPTENV